MLSPEEITNKKNNAKSIINFIIGIPEVPSKMIFNSILDETFHLAELYSTDSIQDYLIGAVCDYYDRSNGIPDSIIWILGGTKEVREIIERYDQGEILKEDLIQKVKMTLGTKVIDKNELLHVHDAFSINIQDTQYVFNTLDTRIDLLYKKQSDIPAYKAIYNNRNPFDRLCYQTVVAKLGLYSYSLDECSEIEKGNFMYLYCDGKYFSYYFDTILNCKVLPVSEYLLQHLTDICKKDKVLCDIVNATFSSYKQTRVSAPHWVFECESYESKDTESIKESTKGKPYIGKALGPIKAFGSGAKAEIRYRSLWENLCNFKGDDGKHDRLTSSTYEVFRAAFNDKTEFVNSYIEWTGSQQQLALFLYYAHGKDATDSKFARRAAKIFFHFNASKHKWVEGKENTLRAPQFPVDFDDDETRQKKIKMQEGIRQLFIIGINNH